MSNSNRQKQFAVQPSATRQWLNRLQLIMLFAVFVAPLAGAYYVYSQRDVRNFSTVNNGELYSSPQDLIDLPLEFESGAQNFNHLEKKWYLVVIADASCDAICEKNLLTIRQLRRMQGKNINRVVSLFVHSQLDAVVAKDLAAKYSITTAGVSDVDQFKQWLRPFYTARGSSQFDASRIYVVDPLKKLMMSYPADVEPKGFHQDLQRLLKVSQIG